MCSPEVQRNETQWNAVVLGGGDPGDPFAAQHGVSVKPLIPIAGHAMAWYVLRALRESGCVKRIAYVGPTTPEMEAFIDVRVTDRGQLLNNLEAGVHALGENNSRILVVTADIPLVTPQALRDVLLQAPDAALVYPVVRQESCEAAYPGIRRTYAHLRDGTFTGGNVFLLEPSLIGQFMPRLREVLAARKAPLKLARQIGLGTLYLLLTRQLTVIKLERKVSEILGISARALITPHAAIGTDVDKPSDLALTEQQLSGTLTAE